MSLPCFWFDLEGVPHARREQRKKCNALLAEALVRSRHVLIGTLSVAAAFEVSRRAGESFIRSPALKTSSMPRSLPGVSLLSLRAKSCGGYGIALEPASQESEDSPELHATPRAQATEALRRSFGGIFIASAGVWGVGRLCGGARLKVRRTRGTCCISSDTLRGRLRGIFCIPSDGARRGLQIQCQQQPLPQKAAQQVPLPTPRQLLQRALPAEVPKSDDVPSDRELNDLFDKLDVSSDGTLSVVEVQETIAYLERRCSLGLTADDEARLYAYLANLEAEAPETDADVPGQPVQLGISREQFVRGIRQLTGSLLLLKEAGCTLQQLKVVLVAAFERFDADSNGKITLNEFMAAAACMGLDIDPAAGAQLHAFLCSDQEDAGITVSILARERSLEEKLAAVGHSLEQMRRSKGIDGILDLMGRIQKELASGGTWEQKVQRVQNVAWDGINDICNILELGVDVASIGVALASLAEILEETGSDQTYSVSDILSILPFVTLIGVGALKTANELDDYVPQDMTEDEAQLYGQIFYPQGFPQGQFRKLLSCPGFHWSTAAPGEVFHMPEDRALLVILRGTAEVVHSDREDVSAVLPAGSTVGEVSFLHQQRVWTSEAVRARERVVYASWDEDRLREHLAASDTQLSLRLDTLLTQTMVANFQRMLSLSRKRPPGTSTLAPSRPAMSESSLTRLFKSMDGNGDGVVSSDEFLERLGVLSSVLPDDATVLRLFSSRDVSQDTISAVIPCLCDKLKLGDTDESRLRLFAYLDVNNDKVVDIDEFTSRLMELQEFTSGLQGLSIQKLDSIVFRAFRKFDANSDGLITEDEFLQIAQKLELPLSTQQMRRLFRFFDVDKDGVVRFSEWKAGVGANVSWYDALSESLLEQAQRKGLTQFRMLLGELNRIMSGPGDPLAKSRQAWATILDRSEALAELVNSSLDATGSLVALYGIWREVQGVGSWDDVSNVDLAPFLIFFGILGISATRRKAEGEVSDLAEAEAVLYATGFEGSGFTITEFQKLMKHGNARREALGAGAVATDTAGPSLRLILAGGCRISFLGSEVSSVVGRGKMLGVSRFLNTNLDEVAEAVEPTSVLTLDQEALKAYLVHDESLNMRFNRLVARSLVDTFLSNESL